MPFLAATAFVIGTVTFTVGGLLGPVAGFGSPILCLMLRSSRNRPGRFDAFLDGRLVCTSRQPLFDGARELLRLGYDPATLLTTRHAGQGYDNFVPQPIGRLAEWTAVERDRGGLRLERHRPSDPRTASPMRESAPGAIRAPATAS